MKKRKIVSVLVILLLFTLTACGNDNLAVISEPNSMLQEDGVEETETSNNDVISEENTEDNNETLDKENEASEEDSAIEEDIIEDGDNESSDVILTGEFKKFTTFDIYGNEINEDLIKGYDLVMINIWGTFCPPCINEMPELGELAGELLEKNILLLGICVDVYDESGLETAREIVEDTGADYPHLLVSDDLLNIYISGVTAVPETIFLDSTGTIIGSEIGSRSKEDWEAVIDGYLE